MAGSTNIALPIDNARLNERQRTADVVHLFPLDRPAVSASELEQSAANMDPQLRAYLWRQRDELWERHEREQIMRLQREHAHTLHDLHDEVDRLQKLCRSLSAALMVPSEADVSQTQRICELQSDIETLKLQVRRRDDQLLEMHNRQTNSVQQQPAVMSRSLSSASTSASAATFRPKRTVDSHSQQQDGAHYNKAAAGSRLSFDGLPQLRSAFLAQVQQQMPVWASGTSSSGSQQQQQKQQQQPRHLPSVRAQLAAHGSIEKQQRPPQQQQSTDDEPTPLQRHTPFRLSNSRQKDRMTKSYSFQGGSSSDSSN